MLTKCNHCGEIAVDDSENQAVCHSCGIVADEINFSHTDYVPHSFAPFAPCTRFGARILQKKKISTCLVYGLNALDNLCHQNNVNGNLKTEMSDLFKNICSERTFRNKEDAGVTAACCVFLVQRNYNQAIPMKIIREQIGCTKGKFSFYLSYVKSYFSTHNNEQDSPNTLPSVCITNNFSSDISSLIQGICNKAEKEEKNELMKKVTALVNLANDCWLLTGRSPRSVVVASTYLCWKSMSPLRRKASFCKFCRVFGIRETIAKQRIQELQAFLLKLGQNIPAYYENVVNENNLLFHLDTILENSKSLRNDLLKDVHESEAINCREFSDFRFPSQTKPRKQPSSSVTYAPDMNASDIEISDSEIESYIHADSKKKIVELFKKEEELCKKEEEIM